MHRANLIASFPRLGVFSLPPAVPSPAVAVRSPPPSSLSPVVPSSADPFEQPRR
jgi:hypothetical protein